MTIASSTFAVGIPQADGRSWVHEVHVDDFGGEHTRAYLADKSMDKEAILADHAAQISAMLQESEAAANLEKPPAEWDIKHASEADTILLLRKSLDVATGIEAAKFATIVVELSDDQIAVGWPESKPGDVRAKAQALADDYAKILNAKGSDVIEAAVAVDAP